MKKIWLLITALILISLISLYSFGLKPIFKNYSGIRNRIRLEELKLANYQRLLRDKNNICSNYGKMAKHLESEGTPEELTSSVLSYVENLARVSGIYVTNIRPQEINNFNTYSRINVFVTLQAGWEALLKFIYGLEQGRESFRIEKLQLIATPKDNTLNIDLKLSKDFFSLPKNSDILNIVMTSDESVQRQSVSCDYYLSQIPKRDLFKNVLGSSGNDREQSVISEADTSKDLILVGIISEGTLQAIFEDKRLQKTYILYKGDLISNMKVEDIKNDRVILDYAGKKIVFSL